MAAFECNLTGVNVDAVGNEQTKIIRVSDFFSDPEAVIDTAAGHDYAQINPHYPGIRATVEPALLNILCETVAGLVSSELGQPRRPWMGQAWYSIVTRPAAQLTPIQRLPHFDGFDENQLAVMIYLNRTDHGGTGFYRHRSTAFERITEARYPQYKQSLERDVQTVGLPPAKYISDGAPLFERIGESDGAFNSLVLYPGVLLHSGLIAGGAPLPPDPRVARLTINGFFKPA